MSLLSKLLCEILCISRLGTKEYDAVLVLFLHLPNDTSSRFRRGYFLFAVFCALLPGLSVPESKRRNSRKDQAGKGDCTKIGDKLLELQKLCHLVVGQLQSHLLVEGWRDARVVRRLIRKQLRWAYVFHVELHSWE